MHHSDWFKLRYELLCDYPNRMFDIGAILFAFKFEGNITLDRDKSINPELYRDHFKKLRWWEHRTIEQLLTIEYAKVVSGSNYYVKDDVVIVKELHYNDKSLVGGKNNILFDLDGHHFTASQIEPATKSDYENWLVFNK